MGPFGSNIKVSSFVSSGVPIISGAHLKGFTVRECNFNFITEEHAAKLKNSLVFPGDVIFTHAGNVGQVAMVPRRSEYPKYMISQRQFFLRCNESVALPEYVTLYFHTRNGRGALLTNTSQVGVPALAQPSTYLKTLEIPIPSLNTQQKIVQVISGFNKLISTLSLTNDYLAA